ncbi:MAG TPA: hypothetical protein VMK84_19185 [Streptosporangiaceae bacterium]|nr:hypothetical protein [Streptosporangiaceae bacterium]
MNAPGCPGAGASPALLLNRRGCRLSAHGAHDIVLAIAAESPPRSLLQRPRAAPHLRHPATSFRGGYDLVLVAELMGHARTQTTRGYATADDAQAAINSLPADR